MGGGTSGMGPGQFSMPMRGTSPFSAGGSMSRMPMPAQQSPMTFQNMIGQQPWNPGTPGMPGESGFAGGAAPTQPGAPQSMGPQFGPQPAYQGSDPVMQFWNAQRMQDAMANTANRGMGFMPKPGAPDAMPAGGPVQQGGPLTDFMQRGVQQGPMDIMSMIGRARGGGGFYRT